LAAVIPEQIAACFTLNFNILYIKLYNTIDNITSGFTACIIHKHFMARIKRFTEKKPAACIITAPACGHMTLIAISSRILSQGLFAK
jgi:hypothetical protein